MKAVIVRADTDHIKPIAERVREADRLELYAATGMSPLDALVRSFALSDHSWVGLADGEPVCMFGVTMASLMTDTGRPWMIGTDLIDQHAVRFIKECRPIVRQMKALYGRLENHIDARNTRAIRWLHWLGFKVETQTEPYGFLKLPFHKFTMEN